MRIKKKNEIEGKMKLNEARGTRRSVEKMSETYPSGLRLAPIVSSRGEKKSRFLSIVFIENYTRFVLG